MLYSYLCNHSTRASVRFLRICVTLWKSVPLIFDKNANDFQRKKNVCSNNTGTVEQTSKVLAPQAHTFYNHLFKMDHRLKCKMLNYIIIIIKYKIKSL